MKEQHLTNTKNLLAFPIIIQLQAAYKVSR